MTEWLRGKLKMMFGVICADCGAAERDLPIPVGEAALAFKALGWVRWRELWRCPACDKARRASYVVTGEKIGARAAAKAKREAV